MMKMNEEHSTTPSTMSAEQVVTVLDGELEIEKAARIELPVETDSGIKVALDCLVRGKRR